MSFYLRLEITNFSLRVLFYPKSLLLAARKIRTFVMTSRSPSEIRIPKSRSLGNPRDSPFPLKFSKEKVPIKKLLFAIFPNREQKSAPQSTPV